MEEYNQQQQTTKKENNSLELNFVAVMDTIM